MRSRHSRARSLKPLGQPTRGKTARNRLRQVDHFLMRYDPGLIVRRDGDYARALFVDLGYGAEATTLIESAARLRRLNPVLGILGVEIDAERVAAGLPYADERTFFRLGGFNIPLLPGENIRAIRAFNVLRQYEESDVIPAWTQMAEGVLPGGLLLEGTSTPTGALWCTNVLRRTDKTATGWGQEALTFFTNFHLGFDPGEFQTHLPKNYIHRILPGEAIYEFFAAWKAATAEASPQKTFGLRQWFAASAEGLALRGYQINLQKSWLRKGWLIWQNPPV